MTKQQLIEDNMNLVYALISREYPTHIHDEDIIQCGMVGLCEAADRWDENKSPFSSFAWLCIKHAICKEFRRRLKHKGVLSLDYEYVTDGDICTLGDSIVGEEDVCYIDCCEDKLTPLQRRILELLKKGVPPYEVAEILGTTHQNVYFTQRKIRILRSRIDAD
jgi:RNA polymerase sigma factor (sigma-70 family)